MFLDQCANTARKDLIVFNSLKKIANATVNVIGVVGIIAAGVAVGTIAAAKIAEAVKSES